VSHLLDTNILVYATFSSMSEHPPARSWLEGRLADADGTTAVAWSAVYGFVRLITSRRVFGGDALPVRRGWEVARNYLAHPAVRVVVPGPQHLSIASDLATTPGLRSEDVPDVELAALAIEHGLVLATHDHGFGRFRGLRLVDPVGEM
jgi:uncharacterized protein